MYKNAHACNRKLLLVCYNKNSVVTSCTLNYAYFGVVTETGGLVRERRQRKVRRRECMCKRSKDRFKEKTGLVPWCRIREDDACVCMVYLHLLLFSMLSYRRVARYFYYPDSWIELQKIMWHQFLLSPHLLPVRPLVWVHGTIVGLGGPSTVPQMVRGTNCSCHKWSGGPVVAWQSTGTTGSTVSQRGGQVFLTFWKGS